MAHGFHKKTAVPKVEATVPVKTELPQKGGNQTSAPRLIASQASRRNLIPQVDTLLQQIRSEIGPDFISTDVVRKDGISVAGGSIDRGFNSTNACAHFALVIELANRVSKKVRLGKVEDNLITTDKMYIISRMIGDGSYSWYMAISRNATLGNVRIMMKEYAPQLWEMIPH